jgi:cellobiose transport system substrate-binding protein
MKPMRRAGVATMAAATALTLALAGCGGSDADQGKGGDGNITLTIATFNDFGYEPLIEEYMSLHPDITIEHKRVDTSDAARENMFSKMSADSGLADVEATEVDWMPELRNYPQYLTDLADPKVADRWLDWNLEQATAPDGTLIAYPTNIAPEGICYRSDLFAEAGLPSDRDAVAEALGGADTSWESYFELGKKYVASAPDGSKWFDEAASIYQGMINQVAYPYETAGDELVADTNPEVKDLYDLVTKAADTDGLSAGLSQWGDDWAQAFQNGAFATILCPSWILGPIQNYAAGVEGWDVANVFPGGGGNWGGSYLVVPKQSKHPEEAKAFAEWITAPEQEIKVFKSAGLFPAAPAAWEDSALLDYTDPFFNDAPTGSIFLERAEAIKIQPYKGPNYFTVQNTAMIPALRRVDVDKTDSPSESWDKFVQEIQQYK